MCILQKPEIRSAIRRNCIRCKVWKDFSNHFRVTNGDGKVLLADAFPVHAAKLINLVREFLNHLKVIEQQGLRVRK